MSSVMVIMHWLMTGFGVLNWYMSRRNIAVGWFWLWSKDNCSRLMARYLVDCVKLMLVCWLVMLLSWLLQDAGPVCCQLHLSTPVCRVTFINHFQTPASWSCDPVMVLTWLSAGLWLMHWMLNMVASHANSLLWCGLILDHYSMMRWCIVYKIPMFWWIARPWCRFVVVCFSLFCSWQAIAVQFHCVQLDLERL